MIHVGQAAWTTHLHQELDLAVDIVSAHGSREALFTLPDVNAADEAPGIAAHRFTRFRPGRLVRRAPAPGTRLRRTPA